MIIRELITKLGFTFDAAAFNKYDTAIGSLQHKIQSTNVHIKKMGEDIGKIGQSLTWKLTLPIIGVGAASVMAAGEIEDFEVILKRFIGSSEGVRDFTQRLWQLQKDGVGSIKEVQEASRTLFGLGFDSSGVLGALQMLGDVAATGKMSIVELSDIYGKAMNKNKVDTRQFIALQGAGVDIMKEIAEATGRPLAMVEKLAEESKLGFNDLQSALVRLTSEGGKLHGLAKEMDKTTKGTFGDILDATFRIRVALGRIFIDVLKLDKVFGKIGDTLEWLADFLTAMPSWVKKTLVVVLLILAALGPILMFIGWIIVSVAALKVAVILLGTTALALFTKILIVTLQWTAIILVATGVLIGLFLIIEDIVSYFSGRESYFGDIVAGIEKAVKWWFDLFKPISQWLFDFIEEIKGFFTDFYDWWMEFWGNVGTGLYNKVQEFKTWVSDAIENIKEQIKKVPFLNGLFGGGVNVNASGTLPSYIMNPHSFSPAAMQASQMAMSYPSMGMGGLNPVVNYNANFTLSPGQNPGEVAQFEKATKDSAEYISKVVIDSLSNSMHLKRTE